MVYIINNEKLRVYDLKSKTLLANEYINTYPALSAIINKRYITINHQNNYLTLYDFIDKKFHNLINNEFANGYHIYINNLKYLVLKLNLSDKFHAYKFDLESIVSVNEPKEAIDTLYPNPTQELLSLDTERIYRNYEISDISGIIISQGAIANAAGGTITINISELASGTYFLRFFTETSVDTYQFIKIN